jgi:PTS system nitrogen regulatory IIA component
MNAIAGYLTGRDICLDMDVSNKRALFEEIGRHMEREHGLRWDRVAQSLARREQIGSTGLGQGVAIPHARVAGLARVRALYVRLKSPIQFDAPDDEPVSDVLVLLVPAPATDEHLSLLAEAMQLFSDQRFRTRLHACTEGKEIARLFSAWPEET